MARQALRGAVGVLLAALLGGCLGGQTGQPASAHCESDKLSSSAAWGGTTVEAAANAFVGAYDAPLLWQEEPRTASTHTVVDVQDSVQLSIAYGGAGVTRDRCSQHLSVPVTVMLTTGASGLVESGDATLEVTGSKGALTANLTFYGQRVVLLATLTEGAAGVSLAGDINSLAQGLPGASASFDVEP